VSKGFWAVEVVLRERGAEADLWVWVFIVWKPSCAATNSEILAGGVLGGDGGLAAKLRRAGEERFHSGVRRERFAGASGAEVV
jgi:hypothetical protein